MKLSKLLGIGFFGFILAVFLCLQVINHAYNASLKADTVSDLEHRLWYMRISGVAARDIPEAFRDHIENSEANTNIVTVYRATFIASPFYFHVVSDGCGQIIEVIPTFE